MATVHLGIGSNLGDRQANVLAAIQRLRRRCTVEAVSAFFESRPADGVAGPAFINVAVRARTELAPEELAAFLRDVERAVGRGTRFPGAARAIDLDLLTYGDLVRDLADFSLPHRDLAARAFNLIPLADVTPDGVDPRTGRAFAELAAAFPESGVVRKTRTLAFLANRQEEAPEIRLSIDRVGVAAVRRLVRLVVDGAPMLFDGEFTMVADLAPDRAGVHMSRFSELLEEATLDVLAAGDVPTSADELVARIAGEIVGSQHALRADVRLRARFGLERWTPVSGKRGEEVYTLIGIAHADAERTRCAVGVEAEGMTACPCAQSMVREHSVHELVAAGFSEADAGRALDALPVATHNQRGRGGLLIGLPRAGLGAEVRAADLVEIVESSMSSETYDLLKRPDEFFVVNKAHRNPKFVEDVVRGIMARALETYADFEDETFVCATQVNYESIHKHDAIAEAFGTFGELRRELATGERRSPRTDLTHWLGTRASAVVD